eukprot:CAMPEP_0176080048 /NCGR_PEP_ID=MMETSP0120_2-20121206/40038_1 /TAXON_ID=160619 /ORGANISM="Kryptoperidinium foliaceum, Strain CCMP 1326" /LENGTH=70 /DNA_ID=CAMNT_0017413809 /DNA_START=85 /DNA_END=295 /DNA_ORIENTATION=+
MCLADCASAPTSAGSAKARAKIDGTTATASHPTSAADSRTATAAFARGACAPAAIASPAMVPLMAMAAAM